MRALMVASSTALQDGASEYRPRTYNIYVGAPNPFGETLRGAERCAVAMGWIRRTVSRWRWWVPLLVVAALLAYARAPVLAAEGTTLTSDAITGTIPLQYTAEAWARARAATLPLTAQASWVPYGGGHVSQVSVKSLNNGSWIAFLVEWFDATRDAGGYRSEDFSDAVAVQVAANTAMAPFVCMGQLNSQVQIWQWRAERDLYAGANPGQSPYPYALADLYPFENETTFYPGQTAGNFLSLYQTTPVQTLVAGGPGSLTSATRHAVYGRGQWRDGQWHVIFARPLAAPTSEEVSVDAGGRYSVAFAVWDGGQDDRDGQKSLSSWVTLSPAAVSVSPAEWQVWAVVVGMVAIILGLLLAPLRRRPSRRGRRGH